MDDQPPPAGMAGAPPHFIPGAPPTYFAPVGEVSGTAVALKWGTLFGLLAAALNLGQTAISVLVVNANAAAVDRLVAGVQTYDQCLQLGNDASSCPVPVADPRIAAIPYAFYGTCFVAFALTLPIYLAAGRAGARASARMAPGVLTAGVAAVVSCVSYASMQVLATNATGRSAMLFGLSALQANGAGGMSGFLSGTVQAQVCAFPLTIGCALVLGNWGAGIGMRQVEQSLARMLAAGPAAHFGSPGAAAPGMVVPGMVAPGMATPNGPGFAGPMPPAAEMIAYGPPGGTAFPVPGQTPGYAPGYATTGQMSQPPFGPSAAGYPGGYSGPISGGYRVSGGVYGAPIVPPPPRPLAQGPQRYVPNAAPPPNFPVAAGEYVAPPEAAPRYVAPMPAPFAVAPETTEDPDSTRYQEGIAPPDALPPDDGAPE